MSQMTLDGNAQRASDRWPTAASVESQVETAVRPGVVSGGALRIAGFTLLTVVMLFGVNGMIDHGLRRIDTSSFGVFNRMVQGRIDADILISGSSRALNHFDPRVISDITGRTSFNIGVNGSQTDMQAAVFETYLRHNQAPAVLVQSLDSFTFVTSRHGLWFPAQYFPYLDEPPLYDALRHINPEVWKSRYIPLYGYAAEDLNFTWWLGLRGLFGWNPPEDRFEGFQPRYASWSEDFDRFRRLNPNGVHFDIEPDGIRALEELLRLAREHGSRVVLVYSPVYTEMQRLEQNRDEVFDLFRTIGARYGADLWDYSDSPISSRRDYFVNSEHLNAAGAQAFSHDLASRLAQSTAVTR
jgi:hypothetical protein